MINQIGVFLLLADHPSLTSLGICISKHSLKKWCAAGGNIGSNIFFLFAYVQKHAINHPGGNKVV